MSGRADIYAHALALQERLAAALREVEGLRVKLAQSEANCAALAESNENNSNDADRFMAEAKALRARMEDARLCANFALYQCENVPSAYVDAARRILATPAPAAHPEDFCERCGRPNVVWFAPNDLWNKHARPRGYGIVCPVCFIAAAEADGVKPPAWEVRPEHVAPVAPETGDVVERAALCMHGSRVATINVKDAMRLARALATAGLLAGPVERETLARTVRVALRAEQQHFDAWWLDHASLRIADAILREVGR